MAVRNTIIRLCSSNRNGVLWPFTSVAQPIFKSWGGTCFTRGLLKQVHWPEHFVMVHCPEHLLLYGPELKSELLLWAVSQVTAGHRVVIYWQASQRTDTQTWGLTCLQRTGYVLGNGSELPWRGGKTPFTFWVCVGGHRPTHAHTHKHTEPLWTYERILRHEDHTSPKKETSTYLQMGRHTLILNMLPINALYWCISVIYISHKTLTFTLNSNCQKNRHTQKK